MMERGNGVMERWSIGMIDPALHASTHHSKTPVLQQCGLPITGMALKQKKV